MNMYFDKNGKMLESNILLKISELQYLEQLQKGKLYMNKLSKFRKYEQEGLGDHEEGMILSSSEGIVTVAGVEIADVKNVSLFAHSNTPIFCITSVPLKEIEKGHFQFVPDKRIFQDFAFEAGKEYGAIIIQRDAFIHKLKNKMDTLPYGWYWDQVIYSEERKIPSKDEMYKIAYQKRLKFAHQHEWRLMLFTDVDDHYELEIGDLTQCSRIFPITDIEIDMKIEAFINERS